MSQISILVEFAKADTTGIHQEISLGNMPNFQAQSINSLTGVDTRGAKKVLSAHAIRHILKNHEDNNEQSTRSQIGIVDSDFDLLNKILTNPDNVIRGKDSNRGEPALKFIKELHSKTYTIVMSLRVKKNDKNILEKSLVVNTMYIKK